MRGVNEILLADACASLLRRLSDLAGQHNLDEAFAAWLLPTENIGLDLKATARNAMGHEGAARVYQDVAILGFHADTGLVDDAEVEALENGLLWLAGRPSVVNETPTGISVDAIAILGVALGARFLGECETSKKISEWMSGFIQESYQMRGVESWHQCLFAAAQRAAGSSPELPAPDDASCADVSIALSAKGLLEKREGADREREEQQALLNLKHRSIAEVEQTRAALSLAAYNAISNVIELSTTPSATEENSQIIQMESKKIKILFLAADPVNEVRLRLSQEVREIDTKLQQAAFRDKFVLEQQWAVRVSDLQGHLMRYQPDIVHFSGHGSAASEIILEDSNGNSQPVPLRALGGLFSTLKDNIRCVVLNACFSKAQAEAIAQHIDCVVGMSKAVKDLSAISFAAAFYQALAYGRSVQDAFNLGCIQIDMEKLNQSDVPQLLAPNVDPSGVVFVNRNLLAG